MWQEQFHRLSYLHWSMVGGFAAHSNRNEQCNLTAFDSPRCPWKVYSHPNKEKRLCHFQLPSKAQDVRIKSTVKARKVTQQKPVSLWKSNSVKEYLVSLQGTTTMPRRINRLEPNQQQAQNQSAESAVLRQCQGNLSNQHTQNCKVAFQREISFHLTNIQRQRFLPEGTKTRTCHERARYKRRLIQTAGICKYYPRSACGFFFSGVYVPGSTTDSSRGMSIFNHHRKEVNVMFYAVLESTWQSYIPASSRQQNWVPKSSEYIYA
jgi:hypothetical protein